MRAEISDDIRNGGRGDLPPLEQIPLRLMLHRLVGSADIKICHVPVPPTFKLYLLNGNEAVFGPYLLKNRRVYLEETESEIDALDAVGIGGPMTHFVVDDEGNPQASAFVRDRQAWYESLWEQYAK